MRAMVREPLVVELSNTPEFLWPALEAMSCQSLQARFRRFVTCEGPDERFVSELEVVAANLKCRKQNEIRRRHERPTSPLVPTVFDDWVSPAGQPRLSSLAEFSSMCSHLIYWPFSDWGVYALSFGRDVETAVAPVVRASEMTGIPWIRVDSLAQLPTW